MGKSELTNQIEQSTFSFQRYKQSIIDQLSLPILKAFNDCPYLQQIHLDGPEDALNLDRNNLSLHLALYLWHIFNTKTNVPSATVFPQTKALLQSLENQELVTVQPASWAKIQQQAWSAHWQTATPQLLEMKLLLPVFDNDQVIGSYIYSFYLGQLKLLTDPEYKGTVIFPDILSTPKLQEGVVLTENSKVLTEPAVPDVPVIEPAAFIDQNKMSIEEWHNFSWDWQKSVYLKYLSQEYTPEQLAKAKWDKETIVQYSRKRANRFGDKTFLGRLAHFHGTVINSEEVTQNSPVFEEFTTKYLKNKERIQVFRFTADAMSNGKTRAKVVFYMGLFSKESNGEIHITSRGLAYDTADLQTFLTTSASRAKRQEWRN